MGAATTSVARQRTPRCRASLAPRQRSCASRRGRPSAAAARGRRGRGRARAALQPPPHAREMRAALGAAATSSPAPPGRAQRRDEGGARRASAQSRPAAATSRSLADAERSRGGEAKPGETHRRHNERELLRLPVALPVAPRRGVQSDESPSLRADDDLDVPHRGAGQRQLVRLIERIREDETGGASVEHRHRRPRERHLRSVDEEALDAASVLRHRSAQRAEVDQRDGVALPQQRPAGEGESAAREVELEGGDVRLLEQGRPDSRHAVPHQPEVDRGRPSLANGRGDDSKVDGREAKVSKVEPATPPLHADILPAEPLRGCVAQRHRRGGIGEAAPTIIAARGGQSARHQQEGASRVQHRSKSLTFDRVGGAKGAAAALERNLRQLWLAPLASIRDASAASCRREQAKCGGALEVERAAHMWHLC
eukprot:CAMPEP_0202790094 /NCGR_PEP_ID=MMETSP1388-20130828/78702_1 /ASSEMBLY_ACC=CAM_ASM_000864 /TAXON_ID=37098 /ORGANISM="Isochrysis sp, Strain CCMP1244" /LENGTH=425 /DNA_ID=CAMNT_0049459809 /DNA_START=243 /DNA_END=1521 /DNA_ORIENTATION=-